VTMYTIRNVQGQPQTAQPEFCLQCKKLVNPTAGFALEVTEDDVPVGYLHLQGPCRDEWKYAHPKDKFRGA
jgi:hypothetical protein